MDNHRIKAVIFDLGNVLINFDHRIAAEKISKFTQKKPEEIFGLFFDSGLTGLFEEGKITPEHFFQEVRRILNLPLDFDQFLPIWNEIFFTSEENLKVHNLARSLSRCYKTAVLSNINVLHWEYISRAFPIFAGFSQVITSCRAGLRKPHPLIYEKALKSLGCLPEEAFYTDDRPELIAGAKGLGIHSFVFKGASQLKQDLLLSGVNINCATSAT